MANELIKNGGKNRKKRYKKTARLPEVENKTGREMKKILHGYYKYF
jgi:hypothetical protein